jgi:hypothetical protein
LYKPQTIPGIYDHLGVGRQEQFLAVVLKMKRDKLRWKESERGNPAFPGHDKGENGSQCDDKNNNRYDEEAGGRRRLFFIFPPAAVEGAGRSIRITAF